MCLSTSTLLETPVEGVGYKCFQIRHGNLYTMLQYTLVTRGEWLKNPWPKQDIGWHPTERYRSGFHVLDRRDEAYLYLAHEWNFKDFPWRISSHQYEIFPVRYKNGHTRGTQYGYHVIVADDIYILTDDELKEHEKQIHGNW
jgi:hypothetical protein